MKKDSEVEAIINLFESNRPEKALERINKNELGILAVIKYLYQKNEYVTSADISKKLNISSARMTILLRKLEKKQLIEKTNSKKDARIIQIKLSDKGNLIAKKIKEQIYTAMKKITKEFTLEELEMLFFKMNKIKKIMNENILKDLEDLNV